MTRDQLYLLVTESIQRAEVLSDLGAPGAAAAYVDVSLLEEQIADQIPSSTPEGAIARRGAVRAAIAAGDLRRAHTLAQRYRSDPEASLELRKEIYDLLGGRPGGADQHRTVEQDRSGPRLDPGLAVPVPDEEDDPSRVPTVYVAIPSSRMSHDEFARLTTLCDLISAAVLETASELKRFVRVEFPAIYSEPWAALVLDAANRTEVHTNKLVEADALVLLSQGGGSVGLGFQVAHARGVPILYLYPESETVSSLVTGTLAFLYIASFSGVEEAKTATAEWVRSSFSVIEAGPNYRRSMELTLRPLRAVLEAQWRTLTGSGEHQDEIARVSSASHMTVAEISAVIAHPLRLAVLPAAKLLGLCAALDVAASSMDLARVLGAPQLSLKQWRALRQAQRLFNWRDEWVSILESAAGLIEARPTEEPYDLSLDTPEAWREFAAAWTQGGVA